MKKLIPVLLILVGALVALYFVPMQKEVGPRVYTSQALGISFTQPEGYFLAYETSQTGERDQHAIVLSPDTPEHRAFFSKPPEGTEAPPTITISLFQNNLDKYTTDRFVNETNASQFKLSDGKTTDVVVGGESGLRYSATGLYDNENVVVARPAFVYMFTVMKSDPQDEKAVAAFDSLLQSVVFADPVAPAGQ